MTFDDYQDFTRTTAAYNETCAEESERMMYCLMGLVGEVGELAEKIKKHVRLHGFKSFKRAVLSKEQDVVDLDLRVALMKELGDVSWYLTRLSDELDMKLSDVVQLNVAKLSDRKKRGVIRGEGDDR